MIVLESGGEFCFSNEVFSWNYNSGESYFEITIKSNAKSDCFFQFPSLCHGVQIETKQ